MQESPLPHFLLKKIHSKFSISFKEEIKVGHDGGICGEIPHGDTSDLEVVIPEEIQLIDVFAPGLILLHSGVVEVERRDFAYHEGLDIGPVSAVGDLVGLAGYLELASLIAVALDKDIEILAEFHILLPQTALGDAALALSHPDLTPAAPPVDKRYLQTDLYYLIVFESVVGAGNIVGGAGKTYLGEDIDGAKITLGLSHGIVGLQLASAQIERVAVVLQRFAESDVIRYVSRGDRVRDSRLNLDVLAQIEERAESEHAAAHLAGAVGESALGIEAVELHLQQIVAADASHVIFLESHLVEFLGILEVLAGNLMVFASHKKLEIIVDGQHGHLLRIA